MKTPVSVLDPAFDEPTDGSGVTGAMVHLTTEDARAILQTMSFERQRDADPKHIGMLADMFTNGEFAPGSQITFALNQRGAPVLVDGQHRLQAAVAAAWEGPWHVRVLWGESLEARGVYVLLDSFQKKRPAGVIGRALGLDGITDRMQNLIIAASSYQNQWRTDYTNPPGCTVPPVRDNISRAMERLPYFRAADRILGIGNASSQAKRRVTTAMVVTVMVETMAADEAEATTFWTAVVTNGDGIEGELRDGLIAGRPVQSKQFYNPRLAALAWNQRNTSGKLRKDKVRVIPLEGTALEVPV